jgi:hypothetical protein
MNMSGSTGRSFEHNHSTDSDSSFSADFKDIKMQIRKVGGEQLTEADFGGHKGVWARVVIGEIFYDDNDDHEITWENETTEVQLTWSVNCNLEGEEGIASDSGAGWAGWDDTAKCYLPYDTDIEENEHCMRIVEIEVVSKPKVNKADRKAARKARNATKAEKAKAEKAKAKGSDSDIIDDKDVEVPSTCVHKSTKGDSKGKACGKPMKSMTEDGVALCKKHAKAHAKKAEKAAAWSAIESELFGSGSASEDEKEKSRPVQAVTKQATLESGSEDDESKSDTCVYEFTKGKSLGETCGKSTVTGSDMCVKHKKAADKKAGKEEIEISSQKEDKSSDMAASTQTKNMSTALMEALTEILTGALKGKYAEKALAALQTDEAQAQLTEVIKTNMPTKVIRAAGKAGGRRHKKDPAAPKRGCSSYIFFCKDKRTEVKEANPDMKGTEVTKELGRIWREETSDKQKKKYSKQATADKERYLEEMKDYTPSAEWLTEAEASASDSEGGKTKKSKSKRKPGPKRARSAYIFFCTEMRSKVKKDNDDMDAKEVTAELGRLWREEYKEDKALSKKFNKMAKKDKERFEQEKAEWVDPEPADDESFAPEPTKKSSKKAESESSDEEVAAEPVKKTSSKKKKSSKKSSKKKDALSGYTVFCQQTRQAMREENADWSMSKVTKEMERIWESMDDEEKAAYSQ